MTSEPQVAKLKSLNTALFSLNDILDVFILLKLIFTLCNSFKPFKTSDINLKTLISGKDLNSFKTYYKFL